MRERGVAVVLFAAVTTLAAACGGGSFNQAATTTSAGATANSSATTAAASGGGSGSRTFDVTLSGTVSGELRPGGSGFITCNGDGGSKGPGFEAGISNQVSGTTYTVAIRSGAFSAGTVTFPPSQHFTPGKEVTVQLSSATNQNTKWVMADGYGSGTLSLAGGNGSAVTGSIDGDLVQVPSGANVHLKGTFACTPA